MGRGEASEPECRLTIYRTACLHRSSSRESIPIPVVRTESLSWRHEGDPLCDAVVRALDLRHGQDGLQIILDHLDRPISEQHECVRSFWREVSANSEP